MPQKAHFWAITGFAFLVGTTLAWESPDPVYALEGNILYSGAGLDWLADGQAEPLNAVLAAVAAGAAIVAARHWLKRRRKD